jgi:hypothetical protein
METNPSSAASGSFEFLLPTLVRHGHLALTIAALSFGLAPLQSAVLSGSLENARSIGLVLVATNFFVRGYTLSLHFSSAREAAIASLQEGAAAALASENRGPPGFELSDEEREEDENGESNEDNHLFSYDIENNRNGEVEIEEEIVDGLSTRDNVEERIMNHDILSSSSSSSSSSSIATTSAASTLVNHDIVHVHHSKAASRLVFVPPYTHPVTGIVVPGGWLDEQQLRRALAQHTATSERGYLSLLVSTCLERWHCQCLCNPTGIAIYPMTSNTFATLIAQITLFLRNIVQSSPLFVYSSFMALALSLCFPATVGAVLGSFFLYYQSSSSSTSFPPITPQQKAAISIGLIALASTAIIHASEQDLRFLRLHWRRRFLSMPKIWRRHSSIALNSATPDPIQYGQGKREDKSNNDININVKDHHYFEKNQNRRVERLDKMKKVSSNSSVSIVGKNEIIAIQSYVFRQFLFCLLTPALLVSGLKAAESTIRPSMSTYSLPQETLSELVNIGETSALLLTTMFFPMIIPLLVTLFYQAVGLVAMPYLCSQKWMLWLLESFQSALQAGALVLLLAPSALIEGGGLIGAVAGSVCSAILFLIASSLFVIVSSVMFNRSCQVKVLKREGETSSTFTSSTTNNNAATKTSIDINNSSDVHASRRSDTSSPPLSSSDMIYSIFSLSGRSLSSGLALAYALSPVSQVPLFSTNQSFRTSLLLDGLLSLRSGIALTFTFYIFSQFIIFYIMDEFLRAAAFINRLKESHQQAERDALDAISALNDPSLSSSSAHAANSPTTFSPIHSSSSKTPYIAQPRSTRLHLPASSSSSSSSRIRNEAISPERRVQILADLLRQMQSPAQQQLSPLPSFVSTHEHGTGSSSSTPSASSTVHHQSSKQHSSFPLSPNSVHSSHRNRKVHISESIKHKDKPMSLKLSKSLNPDANSRVTSTEVVPSSSLDEVRISEESLPLPEPSLSSSSSSTISKTSTSKAATTTTTTASITQSLPLNDDHFISTRFTKNNSNNNNNRTHNVMKPNNDNESNEPPKSLAPIYSTAVRRVREEEDDEDDEEEEEEEEEDEIEEDDDDERNTNAVVKSVDIDDTYHDKGDDVKNILATAEHHNHHHYHQSTPNIAFDQSSELSPAQNDHNHRSILFNRSTTHAVDVPEFAALPDPSGNAPFILVALSPKSSTSSNGGLVNNEDIDLNLSISTSASFVNKLDSVAAAAASSSSSSSSLFSSSPSPLVIPKRRRPISRETLSH